MDSMILGFLNKLPSLGLVVIIFISLYFLGKAADYLVDQSVVLSKILNIPEAVVGATIVSLGTTIPEVTVSSMAALSGSPAMALGNAVGSIITNTTLILGIAALIGAVPIKKYFMKKQGLFSLVLAVFIMIMSLPALNDGLEGYLSRKIGFILIAILVFYIVMSIVRSPKGGEVSQEYKDKSALLQLFKIAIGVVLVIVSSKILIPSVQLTAERVGVPESIIAATLVAFGTSVPELMTSISAVKKGYGELAVGNVVGANILNILFVVGLSLSLSKDGMLVPGLFVKLQMPIMVLSIGLLLGLSMNKESKLRKVDGFILLGLYIAYLVFNYFFM